MDIIANCTVCGAPVHRSSGYCRAVLSPSGRKIIHEYYCSEKCLSGVSKSKSSSKSVSRHAVCSHCGKRISPGDIILILNHKHFYCSPKCSYYDYTPNQINNILKTGDGRWDIL